MSARPAAAHARGGRNAPVIDVVEMTGIPGHSEGEEQISDPEQEQESEGEENGEEQEDDQEEEEEEEEVQGELIIPILKSTSSADSGLLFLRART